MKRNCILLEIIFAMLVFTACHKTDARVENMSENVTEVKKITQDETGNEKAIIEENVVGKTEEALQDEAGDEKTKREENTVGKIEELLQAEVGDEKEQTEEKITEKEESEKSSEESTTEEGKKQRTDSKETSVAVQPTVTQVISADNAKSIHTVENVSRQYTLYNETYEYIFDYMYSNEVYGRYNASGFSKDKNGNIVISNVVSRKKGDNTYEHYICEYVYNGSSWKEKEAIQIESGVYNNGKIVNIKKDASGNYYIADNGKQIHLYMLDSQGKLLAESKIAKEYDSQSNRTYLSSEGKVLIMLYSYENPEKKSARYDYEILCEKLLMVDAISGTVIWESAEESECGRVLAVNEEYVFCQGTDKKHILAADALTGEVKNVIYVQDMEIFTDGVYRMTDCDYVCTADKDKLYILQKDCIYVADVNEGTITKQLPADVYRYFSPEESVAVDVQKIGNKYYFLAYIGTECNDALYAYEEVAVETVELNEDKFEVADGKIYSYNGADEKIVIPEYITGIKSFCNWSDGVREVTIPENVVNMDKYAFYRCRAIEKVIIGNGIKEIGENTFYACDNLKKIVIPDSVTRIADMAFCECNSLTEIILPESVKEIERGAFWLENLESIYIPAETVVIDDNAFLAKEILTIYGEAGSYAEAYAKENNIDFEVIEADRKINVKACSLTESFLVRTGTGEGELYTNLTDAVGQAPSAFCIDDNKFYILDYTNADIAVYDKDGSFVSDIDIAPSSDGDDLLSIVKNEESFYVLDRCMNSTASPKIYVLGADGTRKDTILLEESENRAFLNLVNGNDGKVYIRYRNLLSRTEEYVPVDNTAITADGIWRMDSVYDGVFTFTDGSDSYSINCYEVFTDLPAGSIIADHSDAGSTPEYSVTAEVIDGTEADRILFGFYADINGERVSYVCCMDIKADTLRYVNVTEALKDDGTYVLPEGNRICVAEDGSIYMMAVYEDSVKIMEFK